MAPKYPGLYLYHDHLDCLLQLPDSVAMAIIRNLYHYAKDNVEPLPLENQAYTLLQSMIVNQMRRSKKQAELGHLGGCARARNESQKSSSSLSEEAAPALPPSYGEDEYDDPAIAAIFERHNVPYHKNPRPDVII